MSAASLPEAAGSLLVLAGLALLGALIARAVRPDADRALLVALGYPVGAGVFAWLLFLLSWAGVPLARPSVIALLLLALAGAAIVGAARRRSATVVPPGAASAADGRPNRSATLVAACLLLGLTLLTAILSVGLGYYTWDDAAIWATKGYGVALEGTVFAGVRWGAMNLSYPLNIPLQVSVFRVLFGDLLPGSKLIFPVYFFSLGAAVLRYIRRRAGSAWLAVLGLLTVLTIPTVFQHATTGYANLAFAVYLVSGVLCMSEALADRRPRGLALGALVLGLAIWTRPEGVLMWATCILAVALSRPWKGPFRGREIAAMVLPALTVGGPWLVFRQLFATPTGTSRLEDIAVGQILAGDIRWTAFYPILRYIGGQMLRLEAWGPGLLLAALILGVELVAAGKDAGRRLREGTLVAAGLQGAAVVGMYFLVAYSGDLYTWMSTGLNRMMIPAVVLLVICGALALDRLASRDTKRGVPRADAKA